MKLDKNSETLVSCMSRNERLRQRKDLRPMFYVLLSDRIVIVLGQRASSGGPFKDVMTHGKALNGKQR